MWKILKNIKLKRTHFRSLFAQKPNQNFSPKKIFQSILSFIKALLILLSFTYKILAVLYSLFQYCNFWQVIIMLWSCVFLWIQTFNYFVNLSNTSSFDIKVVVSFLTLKRLRGRGDQFKLHPSVVFRKMYLLKRGWNPGFLWLLILSSVTSFLKISLKLLKSFRNYEEFICQYSYFPQFSGFFDMILKILKYEVGGKKPSLIRVNNGFYSEFIIIGNLQSNGCFSSLYFALYLYNIHWII